MGYMLALEASAARIVSSNLTWCTKWKIPDWKETVLKTVKVSRLSRFESYVFRQIYPDRLMVGRAPRGGEMSVRI